MLHYYNHQQGKEVFVSLSQFQHAHSSSWEKPWLPSLGNGILRPHPYCSTCGVVKNISHDRAKGLGHYTNVLSEMKRCIEKEGGRISSAQIRLICRELEAKDGFGDAYWMQGNTQRSIFTKIVRKYTNLSHSFIEGFL
jgi:hypothetical protein